jgi:ferric-dicitrate binding protein FerR (iron transport regulator)
MEDGAQVTLRNGALQYAPLASAKKEMQYNTMTTPRGRQFRIMLPDGTEVWLNAASSIRYPVEFNSTERRVEITGEAFFHVKSLSLPAFNERPAIKVPFVVNVNKQMDVEVLGTQFNVNAYPNEQAINTTLMEGVVRVRTMDTKEEPSQTAMLIPGQQASVKNKGNKKITVQDADINKVMAWKNGLFNFENVSLADAMLQLERWYDIDVVYENGIPDIWFSGKISRDTRLAGLLKILEKTGVQFRLDGRKLIVLQDN